MDSKLLAEVQRQPEVSSYLMGITVRFDEIVPILAGALSERAPTRESFPASTTISKRRPTKSVSYFAHKPGSTHSVIFHRIFCPVATVAAKEDLT